MKKKLERAPKFSLADIMRKTGFRLPALILLFVCTCSVYAQIPNAAGVGTDALFRAIRSGSTEELQKQLSNGSSPNDSLLGYSALMAVTLNGSAEQMRLLIEHGANVNFQSVDGVNALWLAVPDAEKISLLLDHGADVNHKVDGYNILVKLASIPGTIDIFRLLISRGADLKKSASDNHLLYSAAFSGDTAIFSLLLHSGFKVTDTISIGDYPIYGALNFRQFDLLKMFVDNGADPNTRPMWLPTLPQLVGCTPLMMAALNNDRSSFLYLLDHGADPNLRSKNGYTALMMLQQSETDDPEMTLALINHGADIKAKAPDGSDALYFAQRKGNTPSVALLKKYAAR
jgi:uncharacterized protein